MRKPYGFWKESGVDKMSKNMKYSEVRQIVYNRYHGKCAICGQRIKLSEMCINLIVPKSKGGYKEFSNMQAVCETCGKMKHNMTQEEFFRKVFGLARRNAIKYFKWLPFLNRKECKKPEIERMLKEYRERAESVKFCMGWDDYFNLIEISEKTNTNNAVDLAFRLGHIQGEEDLKNYLLSHFAAEVE